MNNGDDRSPFAVGLGTSSPLHTLSRVLLNSLLCKSANECEELKKQQQHQITKPLMECILGRDREVRWMLLLGRRFRLGLSTVGLGIALLDRITRLIKIHGKYLHCMAVAALSLAVKFHEEIDAESEAFEVNREAALLLAIPSPLLVNADDLAAEIREQSMFSPQELNQMERTLLNRFHWDLLLPSYDRFLCAMLAVIGTPHLAVSRILRRNFELIVSSGRLVWSYSASVLALSTLSVMLEFTTQEWLRITRSLANIFEIDNSSLQKCRDEAGELLRNHYWAKSRQKKPAATIPSSAAAAAAQLSPLIFCATNGGGLLDYAFLHVNNARNAPKKKRKTQQQQKRRPPCQQQNWGEKADEETAVKATNVASAGLAALRGKNASPE